MPMPLITRIAGTFVASRLSGLLPLLGALAMAGCAGRAAAPAAVPASAPGGGAPVPPQVLLLGEVHDNAQGQRMRYELLRQRVEAGWRPAIVMEQFDLDSQGLLTEAQNGCLDAECVIRAAGGAGWDWQLYYPLIQLALTHHLPLIAGNLSRADASRVVRDGLAGSFDPKITAAYHLEQPLPADIAATQREEIKTSHCNMLPDMMLDGMVNAQVARDIWMARLIRAQQPRDVVLIAGNGHVRKDIGVARWLNQLEPRLAVRSEGFVEGVEGAGRYDAVHALATQSRSDPCARVKSK